MGCSNSTPSSVADEDGGTQQESVVNAIYYPNWKVYSGKQPAAVDLACVSHVFYAFALVQEDGTVYLSDSWADVEMPLDDGTHGCLTYFARQKRQYKGLRLVLSIGGANGSGHFASIAADGDKTARFIESARELAEAHGLDGFDIDWEHPTDPHQGQLYVTLLQRMREAFPAPQYLLTTALSAGTWVLQNINLSKAIRSLDYINLMTYDFAGPWCAQSGHHAQLFTASNPHSPDATLSCQSALDYLHSQHVPPRKILLGIPLYGRSFPGTSSIGQAPASGADHQEFDYCDLPLPGTEERHDDNVGAGYCIDGNAGFVSYDTPRTVQQKARFAQTRGLGGLFYWHAAADADGSRSLVRTGYNALSGQ